MVANLLTGALRARNAYAIACKALALGAAFAATESSAAQGRPLVVATNTIVADIVRQVAGPLVEVHCLVPAGVDIHGFEPKPGDVAQLEHCELVVSNGAGFEPWLERLLEAARYRGPHLEASRGVPLLERAGADEEHADEHAHDQHDHHDHHDHGSGLIDPHAWQNPVHGIRYALNIRGVLAQILPEKRDELERRAQLYVTQLEVIHGWMRRVFAAIPPTGRRIVTSHDSFAYLAQAADLEVIPVRGLDLRQEPDARRTAGLVDELRARNIRAIFIEAVSNPKMLEQLAADTGASIGGELFSDSLGPASSGADSYIGLLRENTLTIARALGGQ